ncbi:unnamed protein product [Schistocephalus solidus]|uniref:Protein-serine/threonine phosphatase n=1 Tax=Schistocephalus solidus TaxID=70667 RepID=A0A183TE83_SCHSO|nr:unnamed protein product [Schistocephalus solidus]
MVTDGKSHVGDTTVSLEAILALHEESLFQMAVEIVKEKVKGDFFGDTEKRDTTEIITEFSVAFALGDMEKYGLLEILRTCP